MPSKSLRLLLAFGGKQKESVDNEVSGPWILLVWECTLVRNGIGIFLAPRLQGWFRKITRAEHEDSIPLKRALSVDP